MDSNTLGKSSFFSKPSSFQTTETSNEPSEDKQAVQAAQIIQHWWKQMNLKHTAKETSRYINDVVSLEQAQTKSFS